MEVEAVGLPVPESGSTDVEPHKPWQAHVEAR